MREWFVLGDWQVAGIHKALAEADAGDFATDEEVEEMFSELLGTRRKPT